MSAPDPNRMYRQARQMRRAQLLESLSDDLDAMCAQVAAARMWEEPRASAEDYVADSQRILDELQAGAARVLERIPPEEVDPRVHTVVDGLRAERFGWTPEVVR